DRCWRRWWGEGRVGKNNIVHTHFDRLIAFNETPAHVESDLGSGIIGPTHSELILHRLWLGRQVQGPSQIVSVRRPAHADLDAHFGRPTGPRFETERVGMPVFYGELSMAHLGVPTFGALLLDMHAQRAILNSGCP